AALSTRQRTGTRAVVGGLLPHGRRGLPLLPRASGRPLEAPGLPHQPARDRGGRLPDRGRVGSGRRAIRRRWRAPPVRLPSRAWPHHARDRRGSAGASGAGEDPRSRARGERPAQDREPQDRSQPAQAATRGSRVLMIAPDLARSLLRTYGSPLYAYDLDEADRRARSLLAVLPPGASLYYSLKANPLPALVRALKEQGCGAEVSSLGELAVASDAGVDPSRTLFGGPGKTSEEMTAALAAGVRHFSCESWVDVRRLDDVARRAGIRAQVLLRI